MTIIITQAVGVTPGQQAGPLAAQLELLSQAPAVAELLSLSGLTLAQAGKPQIIDLSAAALAAAGLGRGGTLAAASALGSEAAALGQAWGAAAGSDSSSGAAGQAAGTGSGVAAPAVIGIAVAVAVSVVAVCIAAVAIVVVKQRAKHARAAAAADGQQLPKNSKVGVGTPLPPRSDTTSSLTLHTLCCNKTFILQSAQQTDFASP